jgi:hypothetical protein
LADGTSGFSFTEPAKYIIFYCCFSFLWDWKLIGTLAVLLTALAPLSTPVPKRHWLIGWRWSVWCLSYPNPRATV